MDRERLREVFIRYLPEDHVEQLAIQAQWGRMSARAEGKYDPLLATLSLLSNFNPLVRFVPFASPMGAGLAPGLEVSYHFGRAVDDVVDGDAELPSGFTSVPEWLQFLRGHIDEGGRNIPKGLTVEFLLKRTLRRMQPYDGRRFGIQSELRSFLGAMEREYDRRVNRKVLNREELSLLYRDAFGPPHTITLEAVGSRTIAQDIPELAQAQGRLFAIADLKEDLARGIINIPQEVLELASLRSEELVENPGRIKHRLVGEWIESEISDCAQLIQTLREKKLDWRGRAYVSYLLKGFDKFYKGEK